MTRILDNTETHTYIRFSLVLNTYIRDIKTTSKNSYNLLLFKRNWEKSEDATRTLHVITKDDTVSQ